MGVAARRRSSGPADVAQRWSSGFVNRRLGVRISPSARSLVRRQVSRPERRSTAPGAVPVVELSRRLVLAEESDPGSAESREGGAFK